MNPSEQRPEVSIDQLKKAQNFLKGIGPSLEEVTVIVQGVVQAATYRVQEAKESVPQHVMDIRIGGGSPSMTVRYNSSELDVIVDAPYERVKKIKFPGIIGLQQGDNFRAYLVAADVQRHHGMDHTQDRNFLISRELGAEERAYKIEKYLGPQIVATFISE